MFFINLFRELRQWYIVKKVAEANKEYLSEKDMRVDWVGRIYTVINLPEDIASNPYSKEPYVLEQLRKYDEILIKLGLTELVFPEFEPIPETDSYLLVLKANTEYVNFWRIIWNVLKWVGVIFILKVGYSIALTNNWFEIIHNFIIQYI